MLTFTFHSYWNIPPPLKVTWHTWRCMSYWKSRLSNVMQFFRDVYIYIHQKLLHLSSSLAPKVPLMDVQCHLPGHVLAPLASKSRNVEGKSFVDLYQKGRVFAHRHFFYLCGSHGISDTYIERCFLLAFYGKFDRFLREINETPNDSIQGSIKVTKNHPV